MNKILVAVAVMVLVSTSAFAEYTVQEKAEISKILRAGVHLGAAMADVSVLAGRSEAVNAIPQLGTAMKRLNGSQRYTARAIMHFGRATNVTSPTKQPSQLEDAWVAVDVVINGANLILGNLTEIGPLMPNSTDLIVSAAAKVTAGRDLAASINRSLAYADPYEAQFPCVAGVAADSINCLHGRYNQAQWDNRQALNYAWFSWLYFLREFDDSGGLTVSQRSRLRDFFEPHAKFSDVVRRLAAGHIGVCLDGPCAETNPLFRILDLIALASSPTRDDTAADNLFFAMDAMGKILGEMPVGGHQVVRTMANYGDSWERFDQWHGDVQLFFFGVPGVDFGTRQDRIDELADEIAAIEIALEDCQAGSGGGGVPNACEAEEAELAFLDGLLLQTLGESQTGLQK